MGTPISAFPLAVGMVLVWAWPLVCSAPQRRPQVLGFAVTVVLRGPLGAGQRFWAREEPGELWLPGQSLATLLMPTVGSLERHEGPQPVCRWGCGVGSCCDRSTLVEGGWVLGVLELPARSASLWRGLGEGRQQPPRMCVPRVLVLRWGGARSRRGPLGPGQRWGPSWGHFCGTQPGRLL